ncbi:MAG: hypothetical protein JSR99_16875 [Proteobacteria bacterium]|nr:hypothetical protein [Pseudomonadota bacterium]
MDPDKSPDPNAPRRKHDLTSRRAFLLGLYIFVLVVLVKLYWPGWPYADRPQTTPPPAPASGTQVPQN